LAWFKLMAVVAANPNSVLTCDIDIVPVGRVIRSP
jgi:hypothetical protein